MQSSLHFFAVCLLNLIIFSRKKVIQYKKTLKILLFDKNKKTDQDYVFIPFDCIPFIIIVTEAKRHENIAHLSDHKEEIHL